MTKKEVKENLKKNVLDFLRNVAVELSNEMKREAPVFRGRLRQSIQVLNTDHNGVYVGTRLKYASDIQFGTEPHLVPIEPLKVWARRKLGLERLAYAVQHKIAEEGTEPNPFVTRAVNNLKRKYT